MIAEEIRWKQRFANFDRALVLLQEVQDRGMASLSPLEKEGATHRFEYCFELAWKTLRDYLEFNGVVIQPVAPREVLKSAFQAQLIDDGQVWIDMMLHRNLLSHTYDQKKFNEILAAVETRYFSALDRLHEFLLARMVSP